MILEKTVLRESVPEDRAGILAVQRRAFENDDEANLVERLLDAPVETISMIAELDGMIIGHVLLSELGGPERTLALAPMAADPQWQGFGIGTALARHAIEQAAAQGWHAIFVVGDPQYYERFGFRASLAESRNPVSPGLMSRALATSTSRLLHSQE